MRKGKRRVNKIHTTTTTTGTTIDTLGGKKRIREKKRKYTKRVEQPTATDGETKRKAFPLCLYGEYAALRCMHSNRPARSILVFEQIFFFTFCLLNFG